MIQARKSYRLVGEDASELVCRFSLHAVGKLGGASVRMHFACVASSCMQALRLALQALQLAEQAFFPLSVIKLGVSQMGSLEVVVCRPVEVWVHIVSNRPTGF
jgi:hypothetical protein